MREHAVDSCAGSSPAEAGRDAATGFAGSGHHWGHIDRDTDGGHPNDPVSTGQLALPSSKRRA
ncbi:hypothetical protein [Streptomyces sp. NPDC001508]|uniref:hypothetical protein n=1 Tax=Streptomyces sp. NPDC001508 TaxID=3154656 RepID=UPI00332B5A38